MGNEELANELTKALQRAGVVMDEALPSFHVRNALKTELDAWVDMADVAAWIQRVGWISAMGGMLMTQGYDYLPDGAVSGILEWLIYEDELDKAPRGRGVTLEAALDDARAHWRWSTDDATLVRIRGSQPHPALPVAEPLEDSRALRAGFLAARAWIIDRMQKWADHPHPQLREAARFLEMLKPGSQLLEDAMLAGKDLCRAGAMPDKVVCPKCGGGGGTAPWDALCDLKCDRCGGSGQVPAGKVKP